MVLQIMLGGLVIIYFVRLIMLITRGVTDSRLALAGLIFQLFGAAGFGFWVFMLSGTMILPGKVIWAALVPGLVLALIGITLWVIGRGMEREPVLPLPTPQEQRAIDDDMWGWDPSSDKFHKPAS